MYTIRVSNGFDTDQDRRPVGPDQGPNCLQRKPADNKITARKERVNGNPNAILFSQVSYKPLNYINIYIYTN